MNRRCSICGSPITSGMTEYGVNKNYPNELLCEDCALCIMETRAYAKEGNALFKAARKELLGMLNAGSATEGATAYCTNLIIRLNRMFQAAVDSKRVIETQKMMQPPQSFDRTNKSSAASFNTCSTSLPFDARPPACDQSDSVLASPGVTVDSSIQAVEQRATNVVCGNCGADNLPDSAFCESCAAPLKPPKYCRYCGGPVSPVTDICENCLRNRDGIVNKPKAPGAGILASAENAGRLIANTASTAGRSVQSMLWTPWVSAAIALVLGLMLIGKMISVPAVSFFSDSSSFSLFQISKLADQGFGVLSDIQANDLANTMKGISFLIILFEASVLIMLAVTIVSTIQNATDAPQKLGTSSKFMVFFLTVLLLAIIITNRYISENSDGWIQGVLKPTTLFYFAYSMAIVVAFYASRELQYQTAVHLERCGCFEQACTIYSELHTFRDSASRLENAKRRCPIVGTPLQ